MKRVPINETPINVRQYYKYNRLANIQKLEKAKDKLEAYIATNANAYEKVKANIGVYSRDYGFIVSKYSEFVNNKHIDGSFLSDVKVLFTEDEEDKNNKFALIVLLRYANTLQPIFELQRKMALYEKIISLTIPEYIEYVRTYYTAVQRELIIKANGYEFPNSVGFLCVNRCKLVSAKKKLNHAATKRNKLKLIAEGVELFDKKAADYCAANNIEYNGVDYRIFLDVEHVYEFALCYPRANGSYKERFEPADYRYYKYSGKTNEDFIREANGSIDYIMEQKLDVRTKLMLCLQINKTLYNKFIRNDKQLPLISRKTDRKNR